MTTNEKCPNCGKRMYLETESPEIRLRCVCGISGPVVRLGVYKAEHHKVIAADAKTAWHAFLAKVRAGK
jgi:hypothetical protein